MASTTFQDYNQNTPVVAAWLNDVNNLTYSAGGVAKGSILMPVAWVRFSVSGASITIQQSANVSSVVSLGTGEFQINYNSLLTSASNCYELSINSAGFVFPAAETTGSVTINTTNTSNVAFNPGFVSVVVYGAN